MRKGVVVGGAAAGAAVAALAYAVRGRSSALLAPSVYKGVTGRRAVALTFDDGPSESTPKMLSLLNRYNVSATFFQCGRNVRRLPQVARDVVAAGHEIGNHSDSHPKLRFKTASFIYSELAAAQESIQNVTGVTPRLFRAPYGIRWFGLRAAQRKLNLLGVMWTTIGRDWKWPAERVIALLENDIRDGAIFCLHDGRAVQPQPDISVALEAVGRIIPVLIDQGFHFETVSQILCPTI